MASNLRRTENLRILKTNELIVTDSATISSDTYVGGDLYVGGSTTMNTIRFLGTTGDNIPSYRHTIIAEHIYDATENSELLLFKGNNAAGLYGPDRVRVASAGGFKVDITPSFAQWDPDTQPAGPSVAIPNCICVGSAGNVGIRTGAPAQPLDVSGNVRVGGNLFVGGSNQSNSIRFLGTTGDNQTPYTNTIIAERRYDISGNNEKSELLLFKADNPSGVASGPDRVRIASSGGFKVDISNPVNWNPDDLTNWPNGPTIAVPNCIFVGSTGNVGIRTGNPTSTLDVSGDVNVGRVLILNGGTAAPPPDGLTYFIDPSNLTNTYISFRPNGANSDFAYLRQTGAFSDDSYMLSLDFHDNGGDAGFQIRDINSVGATADTITTRFKIERVSGNVSIGTDAPQNRLTVVGGGANIMGNVGIGVTFPSYPLDVNGTVSASALLVQPTASTAIVKMKLPLVNTNSTQQLVSMDTTTNQLFTQPITVDIVVPPVNYIACGATGNPAVPTLQWSNDGFNWYGANSGWFTDRGYNAAYGNGLWVAVGKNTSPSATTSIKFSTDGKNWSNRLSGGFTGGTGYKVAWNGSIWVASGESSTLLNTIQWSIDGKNWNNIISGGFDSASPSSGGYGIVWTGSVWLATGFDSAPLDTIQRSTDGKTWTSITSGGFSPGGGGITSYGTLNIAVGGNSNFIQYSPDTLYWTTVPVAPNVNADVATNTDGSIWIAVGGNGSGDTTKTIYRSVNPTVSWTSITSGGFNNAPNTGGRAIIWDGAKWIATGYITGTNTKTTIKTSIDGLVWQDISSGGFAVSGEGLAYASSTTLSSTTTISGNLSVVGDITANGVVKTFRIPHPVLTDTELIHSCIEGPRADLIYRGRKQLVGGVATVDLNRESTGNGATMVAGTFEALCANPQTFLQNNSSWDRVQGDVSGATLRITAESPTANCWIDWMVVAERKDASIKTSPLTDDDGFLILEHPL